MKNGPIYSAVLGAATTMICLGLEFALLPAVVVGVVAYAAGNMAGALVGCCPINGSVSRTGIAEQNGCKSQVMSLSASVSMGVVLLFGTDILAYLPVPILTGIVMAALIGTIEFGIAKKVWNSDKHEFLIFLTAFLGVLILGTIYGVILGVVLSFIAVIIRAVNTVDAMTATVEDVPFGT